MKQIEAFEAVDLDKVQKYLNTWIEGNQQFEAQSIKIIPYISDLGKCRYLGQIVYENRKDKRKYINGI